LCLLREQQAKSPLAAQARGLCSRSGGVVMNDEIRMTNDERMSKHEARKSFAAEFRHLLIRHSFELRHSSFVIITV
jgi:hypothetical protein